MSFDLFYSEYVVRPLFNVLIWLYNNYAHENLGYAVILFTVGLRAVLLPLTFLSEASEIRYKKFVEKAHELEAHFKKDRVALKIEMRNLMTQYHLKPWAKTLNLLIQALTLVVLYRVFTVGIKNGVIVSSLYSWVDVTGKLNLDFFGTNIGLQSLPWALVVGVALFVMIRFEQRGKHVEKRDLWFGVLFPLISVLALWWLPMVKSIFILTSMAISVIIKGIEIILFKLFVKKPAANNHGHH